MTRCQTNEDLTVHEQRRLKIPNTIIVLFYFLTYLLTYLCIQRKVVI